MGRTAFRIFQHWDNWLTHFLGKSVIEAEQSFLSRWIKNYRGKHSLLLGVPEQYPLLNAEMTNYFFNWLLTPLFNHRKHVCSIESGFYDLPVAAGSIDLLLLPHSLELLDNPKHALTEACRLVKPEGYIVVIGFNPCSLWGLKHYFSRAKKIVPWSHRFIRATTVKQWLMLSDFKLMEQHTLLYRPPVHYKSVYKRLNFLEKLGRFLYRPFGGIYILIAQAKVTPLTPIRWHWRQRLADIPISTTMPGSTMRDAS